MGLRPTDGDEERAKGGEYAANRRSFFRGAALHHRFHAEAAQ